MTTILADFRLGLMVADSNWSDGVQKGSLRKVWRIRGSLIGCAGNLDETSLLLKWYREGAKGQPPKTPAVAALILNASGLYHCAGNSILMPVQGGVHAIGTGGVAAMCTLDALGRDDPVNMRRAVSIVCKHDAGSWGPVRVYRLGAA